MFDQKVLTCVRFAQDGLNLCKICQNDLNLLELHEACKSLKYAFKTVTYIMRITYYYQT